MLNSIYRHQASVACKVLFGLCLALLLVSFLLFPAGASAHTRTTASNGPTLQINVGFEDDSRVGYWTPVQIILSNDGANFTGTLSATTYTSPLLSGAVVGDISPWSYQQPVTLPHGTEKQVNLYVPFYESPSIPRAIIATLLDSHNKVILTQTQTPYSLRKGAIFIGILSDLSTGFDALGAVTLPSPTRSIEIVTLNASTLPDMAEMLGNFDVIVLDDFTTSTLTFGQLTALQTWVNQGGALIEIGGTQWQRTLSKLPHELLPVVVYGTDSLPAGTHLLPIGSPTIADSGQLPAPDVLNQSITVSTGILPGPGDGSSLSNLETVLAYGATPLLVQAHQGKGVICYLAFDPATAPIAGWAGAIALWKGLLFRALGDQFLIPDAAPSFSNGPGQFNARDGLFQILQPETLFPIWGLVFLLLGYIILIGPVLLLIVRRLKRPQWSWRIILSGAVVFSLLTYTLAFSLRAATVNSISLIQLNQGGSSAHVTTYLSVFIPGQGNFQVGIPGRSLAQPIPDTLFPNGLEGLTDEEQATVTLGQHETDVNLLDIGAWTLHPIISEQDQRLQGGIVAHLTLQKGTLVGTVTNTFNSSLSDVYVLLPHSFASIGQLPAGETQQVNIPISASNVGTTLADQIASSNGLPAAYFPYANSAQPQTTFQRHLAILSALSGEGFPFYPCSGPCSTHAIVTKHTIVTPPFGAPKVNPIDGNDPLLVAGAPATLIGWADQSLGTINAVTVNGSMSDGTHENLVQVPLNINFSSLANVPPDLISGQVINAQGNNVQTTAPDVYNMAAGSMTFEFVLPTSQAGHPAWGAGIAQINSMTISETFLSQSANISQIRLYNWSTNSWDTIILDRDTFTIVDPKAYTSSDGRVLLRLANQSSSSEVLTFSKPTLSLNRPISGSSQ